MNDTQSQLTSPCKLCGKDIGFENAEDAVMVRVWDKRVLQFRGEGPFHSKCATEYQQSNQKGKQ